MDKDRYREDVRFNMMKIEEERKRNILDKRMEVDYKVQVTQQQRDKEFKLRNQIENLKKLDKRETVERIQKIQQYKRDKVLERI